MKKDVIALIVGVLLAAILTMVVMMSGGLGVFLGSASAPLGGPPPGQPEAGLEPEELRDIDLEEAPEEGAAEEDEEPGAEPQPAGKGKLKG